MAGDVIGGPVGVELPLPWANDYAADEGASAAGQVDNTASGKVVKSELVQPSWRAAIPDPMTHHWIDPA